MFLCRNKEAHILTLLYCFSNLLLTVVADGAAYQANVIYLLIHLWLYNTIIN